MKSRQSNNAGKLQIIPLGGLEQIGMNITAFRYGDDIIVVDCGLAFPEDDMLGVDLVIPDVTYLKENIEKVKAFVITHGHEDHIGSLPYILRNVNVPVYGTRLTIGLIEHKLKEHNMLDSVRRKVVNFGNTITLGEFHVEFIRTNHSIVDAAALAIYTPAGIIVHTGDFKVDYTPVYGDPIDLQRFAEIGKKGVLALMCDSTNAERPGFTPSEKTVGNTMDTIFSEHENDRIIIATFASNVDRVQQIINYAHIHGRKVVVQGRSMVTTMQIAQELGVIHVPENTLIDIDELKNYPNNKTCIITTGSQGESMAALSRMASGVHRKISIGKGDTVIFSSHPIPGNEKSITNVINDLLKLRADVIFQDVHVSGHACQEDIKLIYTLVRPKYSIPVHGEYKHLMAQNKLVRDLGIPKENIFIMQSGDILELNGEGAKINGSVKAGALFVDGLGIGDVGNTVLRDRQRLGSSGVVVVVCCIDMENGILTQAPAVLSRGFVYVKESDELISRSQEIVEDVIVDALDSGLRDWNKIKNMIKDELNSFIWQTTERRPVILPIIMDESN